MKYELEGVKINGIWLLRNTWHSASCLQVQRWCTVSGVRQWCTSNCSSCSEHLIDSYIIPLTASASAVKAAPLITRHSHANRVQAWHCLIYLLPWSLVCSISATAHRYLASVTHMTFCVQCVTVRKTLKPLVVPYPLCQANNLIHVLLFRVFLLREQPTFCDLALIKCMMRNTSDS